VSLLLDRGANIDAVTPSTGSGVGYGNATIAAAASPKGSVIVSLLADRGANLNAILSGHRYPTALIAVTDLATTLELTNRQKSSLSAHFNTMEVLLDRGAEINLAAENDNYGTALNRAIFIRAANSKRRAVSKVASVLLDRPTPTLSLGITEARWGSPHTKAVSNMSHSC